MSWELEIIELKLEPSDQADVMRIVQAAIAQCAEVNYDDGYEQAENDIRDKEPDTSWLNDLETGLRLIDTDRTAAKVYLDRCTKQAGKHLIEVAPCLL